MNKLSDGSTQIACFAINNFGGSIGPVADPTTLEFFGIEYLSECLTSVIESDRTSERAKTAAGEALTELKAIVKNSI